MKVRHTVIFCLILALFALYSPIFAGQTINTGLSAALWEKSEETGDLIAAYNEKENPKKSSNILRLYGSNKSGMKYRSRVNTSTGDTQIYIYATTGGRADKLVLKMYGRNTVETPHVVSLPKNPSLASRAGRIIETAKKYLGAPYRWGGTGSYGFDCSGFTMKMFKMNGVNILRCADEQYYQGYYVSRNEMLPGDLVFFSTYAPGASHVGIYIGSNRFIHASSRYGVTVSSLNDKYYSSTYLGARRMW